MAEAGKILSQGEVDALLSAFDLGEVEAPKEAEAGEAGPAILPYDFRRPERVARDQLRSIGQLHDVFARNLQAALSGLLRTIVEVRMQPVEQLTYSEFINALPNPTVFSVVGGEPFEGNFILEVNPSIAFPILERLLGSGRTTAATPERALTDLEWNLINAIVGRVLEALRDAWSRIIAAQFRVTGRETNPHLVPIMSSNEPVVAVSFEVLIGETRGFLNLCVPVMSIEPYLEKISEQTWMVHRKSGGSSASVGEVLTKSVSKAEVELVAVLAETPIEVAELQTLQEGDRVLTGHKEAQPIVVCVEGRPKFLALPGKLKDRVALKIVRVLQGPDEEMWVRR